MARLDKYKGAGGEFAIQSRTRLVEKTRTYLRPGREQFIHFQLSHMYVDLGFTQYAAGRDYSEVLASLRLATESFLTTFRLKGTTPDSLVRHSPGGAGPADSRLTIRQYPGRDGPQDFGYTNSVESVLGSAAALLSNRPAEAREIITLAESPPRVSHPFDRMLEAALKAFYAKDLTRMNDLSGALKALDDPWYASLGDAISAIATGAPARFDCAVEQSVALHGLAADTELNRDDPRYNLCYQPTAWAVLAVQENVFSISDIPDRPPYFPRDYIEYVLAH
jgi:hypothetical protein